VDFNKVFSWNENIATLLTSSPYVSFMSLFKECKIYWIKAWIMPTLGPSTQISGYHFLCITDKFQNELPEFDAKNFANVVSIPGAVMKRVHVPIHSFWVPTEASDREWSDTKDNTLAVSKFGYGNRVFESPDSLTSKVIRIEVVIDFKCAFRGLREISIEPKDNSSFQRRFAITDISDDDEYEMVPEFNRMDVKSPLRVRSSQQFHPY